MPADRLRVAGSISRMAPRAARVAQIEQAMRDLVARNLPIEPELQSYEDALRLFEQAGQTDTLNLLRHRNPPQVAMLRCETFLDLAHEPIVHRTGLLPLFQLVPYETGFVLNMPAIGAPDCVASFEPQPQLFHVYQEHAAWGRILGKRRTRASSATECPVQKWRPLDRGGRQHHARGDLLRLGLSLLRDPVP